MKKRISTTISAKHYELLQKYSEQFGTQQKALEYALQFLENSKQNQVLSREEQIQIQLLRMKTVGIVTRETLNEFFRTADLERFREINKSVAHLIEWMIHKPLKSLSLKEMLDDFVLTTQIGNWFDSVDCTDNGDHYTLKLSHNAGINLSRIARIVCETLFSEYGARADCELSDTSVFFKVYKK